MSRGREINRAYRQVVSVSLIKSSCAGEIVRRDDSPEKQREKQKERERERETERKRESVRERGGDIERQIVRER